jgi:CHAT domain-containing protein
VAARLGAVQRVFVVPDGALNLVHFAALPSGAGYLVEHGPTIHYLSAERRLVTDAPIPAPHRGLLAMGGPDFDVTTGASRSHRQPAPGRRGRRATEPCGSVESLRFAPLPGAAAEARWIARQWPGWDPVGGSRASPDSVACLVGAAATEAAFKQLAPDRRVLHLATHAFFAGPGCTSAPASGEGRSQEDSHARAAAAASLIGGLAFSGANRHDPGRAGEDGILTAEEIAGLDLAQVEWTVLSACNSGIGDVRAGEGVFGLRRAFEIAGCRSLIMSLWPVSDEVAREWMQALYAGRFTRRLDTASAAQAAATELLKRRRARGASTHPSCWAGFIAAGDWR